VKRFSLPQKRRHLDIVSRSSAGIDDFPIWVQLLPRVFFNVIVARFEKEKISKAALRSFYSKLNTNLTAAELDRVTEMGFKTATADGAYDLDLESYKLLFSNFLLGKTIYGPGNDHLFENGS